jgi:hypothetical protein
MTQGNENSGNELQIEIGQIEANLAFFDARFALIEHRPDTAYKRAQVKAYKILQQQLQTRLNDLQMQQKLLQVRKTN